MSIEINVNGNVLKEGSLGTKDNLRQRAPCVRVLTLRSVKPDLSWILTTLNTYLPIDASPVDYASKEPNQ